MLNLKHAVTGDTDQLKCREVARKLEMENAIDEVVSSKEELTRLEVNLFELHLRI